jgi:hypothetical protein
VLLGFTEDEPEAKIAFEYNLIRSSELFKCKKALCP